jgi:hypothetical protein
MLSQQMIETRRSGSDRTEVIDWDMSELQHPDIDGSDYSKLLAGHLGHLNASQEGSLEVFKQNLQKANLYNPKADDHGWPSNDDTTLL